MARVSLRRPAALVLLLGAGTASSWVVAQEAAPSAAAPGASSWGLGGAVISTQRPYRGVEGKTRVLPLVTYDGPRLRVSGTTVDWKLATAEPYEFTLRARYSLLEGYDASDSPALAGMAERKAPLWLGGTAAWRVGGTRASIELLADATASKGVEARVGVEHAFQFGRFQIVPRVASVWHDRKYVDYFYGVNASEAAFNRPAYDGRATVNMELGVRAAYALAPRQTLLLNVGVTTLGKGIKDSPLVDRRNLSMVQVGYLYRF
ncbi:MipA/OmpV family protein [Xylophilus sp. GW821-FHT01B05]